MSELRANTLSDASGTGPAALTKQIAAKAQAVYRLASSLLVYRTFNVSTVTDNGTGNSTLSFTSNFNAADYGACGLAGLNSTLPTAGQAAPREGGTYTTSQLQCSNFYPGANAASDHGLCHYTVFGDLA